MKYPGKTGGFTLVEVLIAVGIFAVIAAISYTSLSQFIDVRERIEQNDQHIQRLQRFFTLLERDLRYVVDRTVRDEYGDPEGAFLLSNANGLPGELLRFTTLQADFELPDIGQLKRVAWRLDGGELYRHTWKVLDRDADTQPDERKILNKVRAFDMEVYEWSDDQGVSQSTTFDKLTGTPYGLKVTVMMDDGQEYFRQFDMANGS